MVACFEIRELSGRGRGLVAARDLLVWPRPSSRSLFSCIILGVGLADASAPATAACTR